VAVLYIDVVKTETENFQEVRFAARNLGGWLFSRRSSFALFDERRRVTVTAMNRHAPVQASYKKLPGSLSVNPVHLEWLPSPGQSTAAPVTIPIGLIRRTIPSPSPTALPHYGPVLSDREGLQATPATNPKVMIKVFVSENPAEEPVPSVFTFTHPTTARADCDAIQDLIKQATAERAKPKTVADILKDGEEGLLKNTEVQMSLLKADVELFKMFRNLVIEGPLSAEQFWRARVVSPPSKASCLCSFLFLFSWVRF